MPNWLKTQTAGGMTPANSIINGVDSAMAGLYSHKDDPVFAEVIQMLYDIKAKAQQPPPVPPQQAPQAPVSPQPPVPPQQPQVPGM